MRLQALVRAWRVFSSVCALLLLASGFALALSFATAGSGAVIVVDGPPQGAFIRADSPYGKDRMRLRVPLGGAIEFTSLWHIAEGGCERIITSSLLQGDDEEAFVLTQRRRGEFFPIGKPGRHHVVRPLPKGSDVGLYRYRASGVAVCPTRTLPPVQYVDFDVEVYRSEAEK